MRACHAFVTGSTPVRIAIHKYCFMTTLLTIGTFDIPHAGHAALLRQCERLADKVIVGINTDDFVRRYRNVAPIYSYGEREFLVQAMGYRTYPNDSAGRGLIFMVQPDILAIGSDWARKDYYAQIDVDQDWLDAMGIMMVYIPYTKLISSTEIKRRLSVDT